MMNTPTEKTPHRPGRRDPSTLSTADVANLFEVTETTIKRWADAGELPCEKTPGGHRKFRLEEVLAFSAKHGYHAPGLPRELNQQSLDETTKSAILSRDFSGMRNLLVSHALKGDPGKVSELIVTLSHCNIPLQEISDEVIDGAMETVGDLWLSGDAGVDAEHRTSYEISDALAKIESGMPAAQSNGRTALLACPPGELHELGLRAIAASLRLGGWTTVYLGANVPLESLISAVTKQHPHLVCISLTHKGSVKERSSELSAVYNAARDSGGKLVLGGDGVTRRFADALLCDRVCESICDLERYLRRTFTLSR
jgi:excisionase family DNA binding protein